MTRFHSFNNKQFIVRPLRGGHYDGVTKMNKTVSGLKEDQGRPQIHSFAHSLGTGATEVAETRLLSCHHLADCVLMM